MVFVYLLLGLFLTVTVIMVPGGLLAYALLARRQKKGAPRSLDPVEWVTYSLGYGLAFVGTISFIAVAFAGLFFRVFLTGWMLAGFALVIAALCIGWLWWTRARLRGVSTRKWLSGIRGWRGAVHGAPLAKTVLIAGLAVLTFYLVNYNRQAFDEERCLIRAAVLPVHNYLTFDTPMSWMLPPDAVEKNAFLHWNGGQRLGSAVFSGYSLALFSYAGFRITYGLCGLFIFLGMFLAAREVTRKPGASLFGAVALAMSPYLIQVDVFDENLLSAGVCSLALAVLVRRVKDPVGAAVLVALLVGIRHVTLLWYPGLLVYLWFTGPKGRKGAFKLGLFLLLSLVFMSPYIYKHARDIVLYPIPYESFLSYLPTPHSIFGIDFMYRGLLNWPFVSEMMRSPFSPYPPALGFPLLIVERFGILLAGLMVLGAVWNLLARPWAAFLLLSLYVPVAFVLGVQSNWIEPAKMFVLVTVMAPFAIWMAGGLVWIMNKKMKVWLRVAGPVVAVGLVWGAVLICGSLEYKVDKRGFTYRKDYMQGFKQAMLDEIPEYVETRKQQYARGNFFPSTQTVIVLRSATVAWQRIVHLYEDIRWPHVDQMREPDSNKFRRLLGFDKFMHFPVTSMREDMDFSDTQKTGPVSSQDQGFIGLRFDLSKPIVDRRDFVTAVAVRSEMPTPSLQKSVVFRGLQVTWANRRANLMVVGYEPRFYTALLMYEPAEGQAGITPPFAPRAAADGYLPPAGAGRDVYGDPDGFDPLNDPFPSPEKLAEEIGPLALGKPFDNLKSGPEVTVIDLPENQGLAVEFAFPQDAVLLFGEITSFGPNVSFNWYIVPPETPGPVSLDEPTAMGM